MEETTRADAPEAEAEAEEQRKRRMRREAEKLSEAVFTRETRDHLVRAGTELILAVDSMVPRDKIPPEVKEHYLAAKRETILLFKSLLDAQLDMVKGLETPAERPPDEVEPGLRKIELE